mmetsp:Transcript_62852/g.192244  ORF Transcript_62852/g.192244 Transcript_62852/m.192244 type:complete len:101 (+) Transcript_62852:864-1166(+)
MVGAAVLDQDLATVGTELYRVDDKTAEEILACLSKFRDAYTLADLVRVESEDDVACAIVEELHLDLEEASDAACAHMDSLGISGALDGICELFLQSGVVT